MRTWGIKVNDRVLPELWLELTGIPASVHRMLAVILATALAIPQEA
jgi:hypothetical protein